MAGRVINAGGQVRVSGVRAVLFDAVGTLIAPDPSVAVAYREVGRQFGCQLSESEIHDRFRRAFARQEQEDIARHALRTSEDRERDRWRQIVADVLDDVSDQTGLFAALWAHFADPRHWRLYDDAAEWLSRHGSGLPLGIASNFDARLEGIVAHLGPLAAAKPRLFLSTRLGVRKPHPDFFRGIERELRLSAAELLFVGDHPQHDARAAREAGWQAVLVDRDAPPLGVGPAAHHGEGMVSGRIRRLTELLLC
jgi:putative hydrolase of the HAD superfamily